ncbi:MAG: LysM peptidoglycan-binding domain-containing protein, partial [Heliobacteriaceae bacterium]|nr:LysM peptidoglycan-binding domain-containing protein [Heliobacteriaceae bacterium]
MTDFSLTLNKKGKEINTQDIKGGVKKEQINVKFNSIYDAYDEDGNGVLDDKEMEKFKEAVIKFAKDEEFSKREAGKFLKEKGLKNNADDLFSFLEELTKQTENVEKTEFVKGDGKPDAVVITYKNGSVETLFSDKVTSFAQTDEGGNLITETKNEKGELIKKEVVDPDENKTSTTYTNGKKYIETKNNKDGSVEKTEYDDDENPVHKIVTKGSSEEEYEFTDGEGRIISMISDKGLAIEKKTQFTYNEDGTVTQNITEPGKKSIIIKNGDEIIYESTEQDNVTSEKIKTETGWEDKVTDKDGNITENILNAEGKKTSQAKTVDGQIYNVEYDGNGSTKIVVQNGESPAALARKFGCNEKEILDANRETIGKRNYFLAGENIVIPKEIEADAPALQGRRTKEQAKSAYASDEKQRVAQRLQGKQTKEVIADKDYSSWTQYAKEALAKEGVTNPTQKQIVDRTNELVSLNSGISVPKKGAKIHALKTEAEIEAEKKAEEEKIKQEENAKKESETIQKQSAQQIVNDLKKAINGWNNNDDIKAALNRIDNPNELKEVERLLIAEGYKADELYSPIEKFMYKELSESSVKYNSFDLLESTVQKWIQNGALKGEDAANAQARLSARVICDGGDGFGTDYDKIKRGVHLIKAPAGADKAEAKAVYDKVNQIISKHRTFYGIGSASKDLKDYLKGEMWSSEIKYLDGILAQNNSIQDEQKADAVTALVKEAVGGAGTDIEYLKQAISAVNTPEDRKAVEAKLKEYCEKKDIKPQIQGQNSLQAILYDECDTFAGISTDHKEIRKFNEMLISQGAYTEAEVVNLKAEQAALQILEGDFSNIQNAVQQIKDPKVLAKMNELLEAKGYGNLDDFLSKKVKDQTKMDLINAELAGRNLLDENKSADVAFRLFQNSDYNIRAMGLKAIRTNNTAALVDQKLKESGSSLSDIYSQFNKEKAEYKNKAAVWDGLAYLPIVGGIAEDISDKYRENTDVSDNLYLKSDKPVSISEKQQAAYQMTAATFEQNLEKMKQDYQEALDSQGIVSGVVNAFCSRYNIGTTRDDIEARIEHDTETLRLLKIASEGKLTKLQDGKTVSVSFEDVFKERQSEFIT